MTPKLRPAFEVKYILMNLAYNRLILIVHWHTGAPNSKVSKGTSYMYQSTYHIPNYHQEVAADLRSKSHTLQCLEHHKLEAEFICSHDGSCSQFKQKISLFHIQETLLTCTMEVLSKEKRLVQFKIEYNKKAIKKRILAGKESRVELVPKSSTFVSKCTQV